MISQDFLEQMMWLLGSDFVLSDAFDAYRYLETYFPQTEPPRSETWALIYLRECVDPDERLRESEIRKRIDELLGELRTQINKNNALDDEEE